MPHGYHVEQDAGERPDVSFIVATYNVKPFIEEAVRSALSQTDVSVEVIVTDDNSSDGTADSVEAIAQTDPRVRLIRRADNGGPSQARNAAMKVSRGKWLAILDGDDFITPDRSRRMIDVALATGADVIADNFERVDEDGKPTGSTMLPLEADAYSLEVDIASFVNFNILFANREKTLSYCKSMFRADFIREHQVFHREDPGLMNEDYLLILDCLIAGARFIATSESHYRWRMRRGSMSWRLKEENIVAMLALSRKMDLENRFAHDDRIVGAVRRYDRALVNGRSLVEVIGDAKNGNWWKATRASLTKPPLWPLIAKFGSEAVGKRLGIKPRSAR